MRTVHQLPARVLDAIARGNTIEAIKLLREDTGLGLKEAKDLIDQHARGEAVSLPAQSTSFVLSPAVLAALHQGNKIEAIKLLREQTGMGLKEAKDAIDAAPRAPHRMRGGGSPGEVPRGGKFAGVLLAAAIGALLLYFLLR